MLVPILIKQFQEQGSHLLIITQEIEVIIQSLNTKKSIRPYNVPVFLCKILSKHISRPLSYLVNLSFQTGIFPDF